MRKLLGFIAFALVLLGVSSAQADVLSKLDKALNNWKTLRYRYTITTTEAGKRPAVLKLDVWMKNSKSFVKVNKLFIKIKSGDLKGAKVLTLSNSQMYIYLPAFKKIRRIGSTDQEARFLGTALSSADMNLTRYGMHFAMTKSAGGVVQLNAKPGTKAPYSRLDITLNAKSLPTKIKYYNSKGKLLKTETRSNYTACKKGYCAPKIMKMVDHTAGVTSVLALRKYQINGKLKKGIFSKRNLK